MPTLFMTLALYVSNTHFLFSPREWEILKAGALSSDCLSRINQDCSGTISPFKRLCSRPDDNRRWGGFAGPKPICRKRL